MTNQKKVKRQRKMVKRLTKEIIKKALKDIKGYPLGERIKFCLWVIRG